MAVATFDFADYLTDGFDKDLTTMEKYSARSTGFDNLDRKQFLVPALYVLGGQTGMGKTTFAWQMAFDLAVNGERVVYCSYEMSRLDLTCKMIAREILRNKHGCRVTASELRTGRLKDSSEYIQDQLKQVRYEIANAVGGNLLGLECSCTIEELLKTLEAEAKAAGDKRFTVVIDYLQLVGTDSKTNSAREKIDSVIIRLKRFQQAHDATIILLSAFNRESGKGSLETKLSSFKESGGIEYTADVVWGLQPYKAAEKTPDNLSSLLKATPRQIELSCLKNRYGGLYTCYFKYYPYADYFCGCSATELTGETPKTSGKPPIVT